MQAALKAVNCYELDPYVMDGGTHMIGKKYAKAVDTRFCALLLTNGFCRLSRTYQDEEERTEPVQLWIQKVTHHFRPREWQRDHISTIVLDALCHDLGFTNAEEVEAAVRLLRKVHHPLRRQFQLGIWYRRSRYSPNK